MQTPLISLENERRVSYKKVVDLGFAVNTAAYAGGLAGLVYSGILLLQTTRDGGHPTLALGVFVLVLTVVTALVLLSAGRVVLAVGRVGLRALREESISGS